MVLLPRGRTAAREFVPAVVVQDYPPDRLQECESAWAVGRAHLVRAGVRIEHAGWSWQTKAEFVETGCYRIAAVLLSDVGQPEGLMATRRRAHPAVLSDPRGESLIYIDFLETAPWNYPEAPGGPAVRGVGTTLLGQAVRLSLETGCRGRVGLHSLPQADSFYHKCGMTPLGRGYPAYPELAYFEYTEEQAVAFLSRFG